MAGMIEVAKATVTIIPNMQGAQKEISNQLGAVLPAEGKRIGETTGESITTGITGKFKAAGANIAKVGAVATAAGAGMVATGKHLIDMANVQMGAENKLTEVYRARMGATEGAAKSTMKLASAIQEQGVIGDEVTLSGAQQLATFTKMPGTVEKLLPAMDNLLVQQKGYNASAQDAVGIANLMGKVFTGQTGALKRVGISFDENQEKLMKTGTESQKAATLAEVITQNVGEMNKKFAQTDYGKIQQASNSIGDMQEQLGMMLLPVLGQVASFVSKNILPAVQSLIDFMGAHPIIGKVTVAVAGVLAIGGPLLILIGGIISAMGTLAAVNLAAIAPIAGIVAAIAGVIAIIVIAATHMDEIKAKAKEVVTAIKEHWEKFKADMSALWDGIKSAAAAAWNGIKSAILKPVRLVVSGVKAAFSRVKEYITKPFRLAVAFIRAVPALILRHFIGVGKKIAKSIGDPWKAMKGLFDRVVNNVKSIPSKMISFFSGLGSKIASAIGSIIPHVSWESLTVKGVKTPLKVPHVTWGAHGGILDGAQLIGAGEAGKEALLPLDRNTGWMDTLADKLGGSRQPVNVYMTVSGAEDPEAWASKFARQLKLDMRMA